MIANKEPYLRIATKFGLNDKTVNTHGKKHVLPFMESVELQAQAEVLKRVLAYREVVHFALPEKSKDIEDSLRADLETAGTIPERMMVWREINKQQIEQAKLAGAYLQDKVNPENAELERIRTLVTSWAKENGTTLEHELKFVLERYGSTLPKNVTQQLTSELVN